MATFIRQSYRLSLRLSLATMLLCPHLVLMTPLIVLTHCALQYMTEYLRNNYLHLPQALIRSSDNAIVCSGLMLLVLLMTMAVASLSASFAIFLVRERANKSKHVQVSPPASTQTSAHIPINKISFF